VTVGVRVGRVRGRFIGTIAVRVGAGIGNDKDGTMWSSARGERPGVVCHRSRWSVVVVAHTLTLALYSREP